ncbi:MAG: hypothetical protein CL840_08240 [Crocinitomicaceae bacterium]|nr:hypothetical protein [Crocinitomicaceae bacterium]|tara:strand:- start:25423 stop:26919 length:1497 start_codon:yes stop_codon:yes gene_type:complete
MSEVWFKKYLIGAFIALLIPFASVSSPLEILGVVKEFNQKKVETKVYINYFGKDTVTYTDTKGLYDIILDVPFNSGYILISTVDCIGDTIENFAYYATNQQLIVSDFELCKSNFRTYLTGDVFYYKLPARGVRIELSLNKFRSILEYVYTDSSGHFEAYMGTGTIRSGTMSARVMDCTGRYIYSSADFSDGDTLDLSFVKCKPPGETLLTGQISRGTNYAFKDEVKLLLYSLDRDSKEMYIADSATTKYGGAYKFFLSDYESYLIKAMPMSNHSIMYPTYTNGSTFWDEDPVIKIVNLEGQIRKNVPMNLNYQGLGNQSISGNIINESTQGKGLSRNQPAVLLLSVEKEPLAYTYAEPNGSYKFEKITSGEYFIWVDDPGKRTIPVKVYLDRSTTNIEAEEIVVTDYRIAPRSTSQKEIVNSQNAVTFGPNPFVNFIRLNFKQEQPAEVQIISMSGTLLKSEMLSNENTLNTSDIPNGTYLIVVNTEDEIYIQRMIKN